MPSIDLRSVVLLVGVMGLLMSVIIFFLRRSLPPSIDGLREWAAAPAIVLVSMLLLAMRGAIHDFFSVLCGNLLLLAGCLIFYNGARRFFGVARKEHRWIWLIVSTLSVSVIAWCSLIEPDYGVRLRIMAVLMFAIFFSLALLVRKEGGATFSGRFTTTVLFVQSVVILLRFAATFVWPSGSGLFEPFVYQTLYIASFAFTMLLLTVGTVLLASERMRVEFENIIVERKQAEDALRASEFRWKFAVEGSGDGVWDWDIQTDEAQYSRRWKEMLGYAEDDIPPANQEWVARIHPDDRSRVAEAMQAYLDGKTAVYVVEYRLKCKDESYKWILGRGMVVSRSGDGKPLRMIGTHTDITERKQMEERVRQMAFYDTLTKLPNRRMLSDRLSQTMAANRRSGYYGALMFLDLDNFKPLNDSHGHEVGDLLLIEVADRLKSCVREMDTVARFGGDEFVVMISELDTDKAGSAAQAGLIAEKIRSVLSERYLLTLQHEGEADVFIEHRCTASIGVVLFINHEASQDDIIKRADTAMYQAKAAGRNSIRFYDREA